MAREENNGSLEKLILIRFRIYCIFDVKALWFGMVDLENSIWYNQSGVSDLLLYFLCSSFCIRLEVTGAFNISYFWWISARLVSLGLKPDIAHTAEYLINFIIYRFDLTYISPWNELIGIWLPQHNLISTLMISEVCSILKVLLPDLWR